MAVGRVGVRGGGGGGGHRGGGEEVWETDAGGRAAGGVEVEDGACVKAMADKRW
jgi:hypothetical protein